jgi:hypothetical protein
MSVLNFTRGHLTPGERTPHYPLNRMLGQPQGRYRHFGEEKNSWPWESNNRMSNDIHIVLSNYIWSHPHNVKTAKQTETAVCK